MRVVVQSVFHSRSLDRTCGSIFEGINAVLSAFCETKPCLHPWDNGLQWWVYNGCTVRFVYRIFEYSFVLGIFDSLGFRTFVLALVYTTDQGIYSPPSNLSKPLMRTTLSRRNKRSRPKPMEYKMRRREEVSPTTTFWKNITYMNQWKARLCRVGGRRCRVGGRCRVRW